MFSNEYNVLSHFDVILVLLFLTVAFFSFQNQLYFLRVLLSIHRAFSYNIFHDIDYVCFLRDKMPKLLTLNIHKEYAYLFRY